MAKEIERLNCMTRICVKDKDCVKKKGEVIKRLAGYGDLDWGDGRTRWKIESGRIYWMLVVYYKESKSCEAVLAMAKEFQNEKSSYIYGIFKHNSAPLKLDFKNAKSLDKKILNAMRNFGIDKMVELKSQEKISMHWSKMFAVILVLPFDNEKDDEKYKKDSWENLPEDLKKYAKFAIPTSYTPNFDDALEDGRKVLHAEAKLVGDPVRDPAILSVPYDRSWLMRIINKHETDLWKSGKPNSVAKYKVFLYSELKICDDCNNAILQSIHINLVRPRRVDDDDLTKPVIGENFSEVQNEDDLAPEISSNKRVFYTPNTPSDSQSQSQSTPAENQENTEETVVEGMSGLKVGEED